MGCLVSTPPASSNPTSFGDKYKATFRGVNFQSSAAEKTSKNSEIRRKSSLSTSTIPKRQRRKRQQTSKRGSNDSESTVTASDTSKFSTQNQLPSSLSEDKLKHKKRSVDSSTSNSTEVKNAIGASFLKKAFGFGRGKRTSPSQESLDLDEKFGTFLLPNNGTMSSPSLFRSSTIQLTGFTIDTSRAKSNANVVSICAEKLGMREFSMPCPDTQPCHLYWHNVVYADMKSIVKAEAFVNKFPGMTDLAKKISLTQAIRSMKELFPDEYRFYPNSWVLPAQLDDFRGYCAKFGKSSKKSSKSPCYIVKPDDGAQGTGIYLVGSVDELQNVEDRQLVQEYVADPYLLSDKLKFDLRVYAVIRSINPLSIYVAREGMARFCTQKYVPPTSANFDNLYAHLTNYSLNKDSDGYVHSESLKDQLKGSKRLLSTVFHQMAHRGLKTRRLWHDIKMIIVKTVLAMVPEIMLNYEHHFNDVTVAPRCFQIMGFDIIVRQDGTPMLLEVNSSPSLSVDHSTSLARQLEDGEISNEIIPLPVRSIVDEMIKVPLVRDCLLLVLNRLDQPTLITRSRPGGSPKSDSDKENQIGNVSKSKAKLDWESNSLGDIVSENEKVTEDDLGVLKRKKKPHLSEIFPRKYGQNSKHLLILDRAVYLYMQFINIKQSITISLPALKAFLRKCSLNDVISSERLESQFAKIAFYFSVPSPPNSNNQPPTTLNSLPFHGFLQFLFHIAREKFPLCSDPLAALLRLLAFCDSSLRRFGVRSTRLRRTELESAQREQNQSGADTTNNTNRVEIYLLPHRMRRRQLVPAQNNKGNINVKANVINGNQKLRSRSVPRQIAK